MLNSGSLQNWVVLGMFYAEIVLDGERQNFCVSDRNVQDMRSV